MLGECGFRPQPVHTARAKFDLLKQRLRSILVTVPRELNGAEECEIGIVRTLLESPVQGSQPVIHAVQVVECLEKGSCGQARFRAKSSEATLQKCERLVGALEVS